jgi:hypothetical protein
MTRVTRKDYGITRVASTNVRYRVPRYVWRFSLLCGEFGSFFTPEQMPSFLINALFRNFEMRRKGGGHPGMLSLESVESHPFGCAQGRLFRKVRERIGHPSRD